MGPHSVIPTLRLQSDPGFRKFAIDGCRKDLLPSSGRMHVIGLHESRLVGQRLPNVEKNAANRDRCGINCGINRTHLDRNGSVAPD